jgi:hypothetical protein
LHLGIFEQPAKNDFLSNLLKQVQNTRLKIGKKPSPDQEEGFFYEPIFPLSRAERGMG